MVPILVEPVAGKENRSFVGRIIREITAEMPIFAVQNFRIHLRKRGERERGEREEQRKRRERLIDNNKAE